MAPEALRQVPAVLCPPVCGVFPNLVSGLCAGSTYVGDLPGTQHRAGPSTQGCLSMGALGKRPERAAEGALARPGRGSSKELQARPWRCGRAWCVQGRAVTAGLSIWSGEGWWAWGAVLHAGLRALDVIMEAESQERCLNCMFFLFSLRRAEFFALMWVLLGLRARKGQWVMRVGSEHCQQGGVLFLQPVVLVEKPREAGPEVTLDWGHGLDPG